MCKMERMHEEYGGFLPLELCEKEEYYQYDKMQLQRYNSAKAAISAVLDMLDVKKVYVPNYMCPNVCQMLEKRSVEVEYCSINEHLLPPVFKDDKDVCIYVTDYFGIMDKAIDEYIKQYCQAKILIDNCHSFFHEPVFEENIYNVYSCKKFFGVPDGAYLIGKNIEIKEHEPTYSAEQASYLLECVERGTNYCYKAKKQVDCELAENYGGMSILSEKILKSIDYNYVKERRSDNFTAYQEAFANVNILQCEENSVPYMYPLNVRRNIKKQLVEQKIYVPTLWQRTLTEDFKGTLEYDLSNDTLFLPVDQRYGEKDIQYIIEVVKSVLNTTE